MRLGRIQDPEGAKITVMSFKTSAGAILTVQRQTYKIDCFRDATSGRLKVDPDATAGGKHNTALQGSRILLIYKTYMHTKLALDPERCAFKTNATMRIKWITKQIQQVDQHEDCISSPTSNGRRRRHGGGRTTSNKTWAD